MSKKEHIHFKGSARASKKTKLTLADVERLSQGNRQERRIAEKLLKRAEAMSRKGGA